MIWKLIENIFFLFLFYVPILNIASWCLFSFVVYTVMICRPPKSCFLLTNTYVYVNKYSLGRLLKEFLNEFPPPERVMKGWKKTLAIKANRQYNYFVRCSYLSFWKKINQSWELLCALRQWWLMVTQLAQSRTIEIGYELFVSFSIELDWKQYTHWWGICQSRRCLLAVFYEFPWAYPVP